MIVKILLYLALVSWNKYQIEAATTPTATNSPLLLSTQRAMITPKLTIGFIYCDESELLKAFHYVKKLNNDNNATHPTRIKYKVELKGLLLKKTDNPVSLSLSVCQNLMFKEPIYASVIASTSCLKKYNELSNSTINDNNDNNINDYQNDQDFLLTLSSISFTCAYYNIPVMDIRSRESVFSDKSIHSSFIRMSPPYFHQASIWIDIIKEFEWKTVNLIHSNDHEGKMTATRFQYLADQYEVKIVNEIEFSRGNENFTEMMHKLVRSTSKVFLLQAKIRDAEKILKEAEKADLMKIGNVWIVCDDILTDKDFTLAWNGLLITEYIQENDLIYYSLAILKKSFENFGGVMFKKPATNCSENGLDWPAGRKIYEDIIMNSHGFDEKLIEFDDDGDRISTKFRIMNVIDNELVEVGEYETNSKASNLNLNKTKIMWPGLSRNKPDGTKWSANFKIVVIEEKPFIFKTIKPKNKECYEVYNNSIDCPWSYKNNSENYCCYGYCIDLIKILSQRLHFGYELYMVPDGLYGDYDMKNGWNGLMGELLNDRADLILAPLTINPERAAAADFTIPFKYQGITILVQRPFKDGLWIMVFLSVHVVAVVLYLLDRFSPFGKFKQSKTDNTEEDALNLSRAVWFTWGVLLNSGIGEGTPRSFSARVLGMVWAGFAMIMVSSYTANLAAFLVLDRPEAGISGINDARLRNPSENYSYASVRGSAVERYFKRQVELSTMYRTMESKNYDTADAAIEGLKTGKIQAFIWDSARLEYEVRQSCDFITTGELFGRSSYGFALKKGNPWLHKISLEILTLHENGDMEDLDKDWILLNNTNCITKDSSPSTLGLTNMAGVFMLVAGGVIAGIFLIFIEIAYKKRKDKKVREHDLSRNAFATWRKKVEKKKLMKNGQFSASSSDHLKSKTSSTVINSFPTNLNIEYKENNNNLNGKQSSKKSLNKIKHSVKFDSSNSFIDNQNKLSDPLLNKTNSNNKNTKLNHDTQKLGIDELQSNSNFP